MAASSGSAGRTLPDERHLAFAVCIVHSKPDGLTIEEYISLLRQHVAKGRRENALSSVHRHLDRASHWRSEYERIKAAFETAERERLSLKLEVKQLRARSEAVQPPRPAQKKRKRQGDEDVVPVPRSPKRTKEPVSDKAVALSASNVDVGFNFSHLGEPGENLMRNFYHAHALLKSREKTEPALLAQHLVNASNAVSDIIANASKQCSVDQQCDDERLRAILAAATRAIQSLIVGYSRISHVPRGNEFQGHVIYAFVHIMETSATLMTGIARADVERTTRDTLRPSISKAKAKQTVNHDSKQRKNASLSLISKFVASIINLLDGKQDPHPHKPLFEGLAYVLIEKLGTCLYTLVFGRARGATMEEQILASARADDIEDDDAAVVTNPDDMEVKAAKLEAPYLIQLLTLLMRVAPSHFGATVTTKSGKAKGVSKTAQLKDNLAITAKERLQRTLVNCIFGTEGVEQDDPFLDCLKKPVLSGSLPSLPSVREADVREWFQEEVWRLVGWDILSREGGW